VVEPDSSPALVRDTADDASHGGNGVPAESAPSYDEIAVAAYHRYLERGGQHGHDLEDWVDAERSLRDRR
jgi:hypothetical protein